MYKKFILLIPALVILFFSSLAVSADNGSSAIGYVDVNDFVFKSENFDLSKVDSYKREFAYKMGFGKGDFISDPFGYDISDYYFVFVATNGPTDVFDTCAIFAYEKNRTDDLICYFETRPNNSCALYGNCDYWGSFADNLGYLSVFYGSGHNTSLSIAGCYVYNNLINPSTTILYSDIPVTFNGSTLNSLPDFTVKGSAHSENNSYNIDISTSVKDIDFKAYVNLHGDNEDLTSEACEANLIPYKPLDSHFDFNYNSPASVVINLQDFKDTCQDISTYSENVIAQVDIYGENYSYSCYVKFNIDDILALNPDSPLFSERLPYLDFPSLDDYLEDFPDFPGFDPAHPLDSLGDLFKWIGDCLWTFMKNVANFFGWLGECFVTLVKNIGIALYNLVVDIRRLFIFLFKPSSDFFSSQISKLKTAFTNQFDISGTLEKFMTTLKNNLSGDCSAPNWSFNWRGNELLAVDFSMFDKYRSLVHSVVIAISWVLFAKWLYKKIPSVISSMPS